MVLYKHDHRKEIVGRIADYQGLVRAYRELANPLAFAFQGDDSLRVHFGVSVKGLAGMLGTGTDLDAVSDNTFDPKKDIGLVKVGMCGERGRVAEYGWVSVRSVIPTPRDALLKFSRSAMPYYNDLCDECIGVYREKALPVAFWIVEQYFQKIRDRRFRQYW